MASNKCAHIATCEMYSLFRLKTALTIWKQNYCESDFTRCARFQRACGGGQVERNLLPNGRMLLVDTPVKDK